MLNVALTDLPAPHSRTGDEVRGDVFRCLADKLEADPTLLEIPLANIDRWLGKGHLAVMRLEQWRTIVLAAKSSKDGLLGLLALLRDPSPEAVFLKEFSPFPGVLTPVELDRFQCSSAH